MDKVLDFNNFEILRSQFSDQTLRQSIRLLSVFGCNAEEVIFVTNDDRVYCFGRNRFGGLGLGSTDVDLFRNPTLNTTLSGKQITNFFFGYEHWIALTADGHCFIWGNNSSGQLGNGTDKSTATPQLIDGLANKTVVDISCGGFYTLALTSDGLVYGWGNNLMGQIGIATLKNVWSPKSIGFIEPIVSISCGINHSLALTVTGRLYMWGLNSYCQLGQQYRYIYFSYPVVVPGLERTLFSKAICGPNHTILLTTDGYVYTFGDNKGGQIGNGGMDQQMSPFLVSNQIKFKDIIGNKENDASIGVSNDNKFYVWGLALNRRFLTPKVFTTGDSVFDFYAKVVKKGITFKTVVFNDQLKSWEKINKELKTECNIYDLKVKEPANCLTRNSIGRSDPTLNPISNGIKRTLNDYLDIKVFNYYDLMAVDNKFIEQIRLLCVFQRGYSLLMITNDDEVYGLGHNRNALLGLDPNCHNYHKPELNPILSGKQLVEIACGYEHSIGLTVSGQCYAWGLNNYGQLGIGSIESPKLPEKIEEFSDRTIVQICAGAYYSMALSSDGELFAWGHNTFAQLGDKTYNSRDTPTQVLVPEQIKSICCGVNHSLALTVGGQVYIWGTNDRGQLGRPKELDIRKTRLKPMSNRPQRLRGFENTIVVKAVCGPNHTLILTTDGSVYAFGDNSDGQVGNGTTNNQFLPIKLNKTLKIKDIISYKENNLSIALSVDNRIYVWGQTLKQTFLQPKLIPNSYGKSLFDIYIRLSKEKVTFKTININEDIPMILINDNPIQSDMTLDNCSNRFSESSEKSNQFKNSDEESDLCPNTSTNNNEFNDSIEKLKQNLFDLKSEFFDKQSANDKSVQICGQVFLKQLNKSFNNQKSSDLKIVSDNNVIYCHKTILQIRNESFWNILTKYMVEENVIKVNSNTFESFYVFIQYLYGIEPEISVQYICDLKNLGNIFNEPEIVDLCCQHIQRITECIDVTNVCDFYQMAVNCNLNDLENYCIKYITNNWKTILKSESFAAMDDILSKQILSSIISQTVDC